MRCPGGWRGGAKGTVFLTVPPTLSSSYAPTRVAADTYASEARQAVQSVRSRYDIAQPNGANVFTWRRRPDVRGVTALMCTHIPEWDYNQVGLFRGEGGGGRGRACTAS